MSTSETSNAAAESIGPALNRLQLTVSHFILDQGTKGATDDEVQAALKMNPSTQRPRRLELQRLGVVVDSGATRPTDSGRAAVVWVHSKFAAGGAS